MFNITQYLQYRNTPDGKPRVLREGVDYQFTDKKYLYNDWRGIEDGITLANLTDCRPLLSIEIDGEVWAEGDVVVTDGNLKIVYIIEENGVYKMVGRLVAKLWDDNDEGFIYNSEKLGSFFDDPAKYSKLLWNCSEEEGWKKVFKLLGIK